MNAKISIIVSAIKSFFTENHFKKAVIGLSGGVDSALTAKLAVMALGSEAVTALILPNEGLNKPENVRDAEEWAKELKIKNYLIPINPFLQGYEKLPWISSSLAAMNIQARVRMTLLYHYANTHQALVLGTGNKTELKLGYFTKYGDGACDILPIGDLYKTEAWEMARALNLPSAIIEKNPSAELLRDQTDEEEIGMEYAEIDAILKRFDEGQPPSSANEKKLYERMRANEHKGKMPGIIRF